MYFKYVPLILFSWSDVLFEFVNRYDKQSALFSKHNSDLYYGGGGEWGQRGNPLITI